MSLRQWCGFTSTIEPGEVGSLMPSVNQRDDLMHAVLMLRHGVKHRAKVVLRATEARALLDALEEVARNGGQVDEGGGEASWGGDEGGEG